MTQWQCVGTSGHTDFHRLAPVSPEGIHHLLPYLFCVPWFLIWKFLVFILKGLLVLKSNWTLIKIYTFHWQISFIKRLHERCVFVWKEFIPYYEMLDHFSVLMTFKDLCILVIQGILSWVLEYPWNIVRIYYSKIRRKVILGTCTGPSKRSEVLILGKWKKMVVLFEFRGLLWDVYHMAEGNVNTFDLIPKGPGRSLKGGNIIKSSLLIHHPQFNIGTGKKGQAGMWEDQVQSHFSSSLAREDGDLDWDEN